MAGCFNFSCFSTTDKSSDLPMEKNKLCQKSQSYNAINEKSHDNIGRFQNDIGNSSLTINEIIDLETGNRIRDLTSVEKSIDMSESNKTNLNEYIINESDGLRVHEIISNHKDNEQFKNKELNQNVHADRHANGLKLNEIQIVTEQNKWYTCSESKNVSKTGSIDLEDCIDAGEDIILLMSVTPPTQDKHKEAQKELEETYNRLSQKEEEIRSLCENKGGDGWDIVKEKDNQLTDMRKELTEMKANNVKLQDDTADKSHDIEELREELEKIKNEFREREKYHNDMYLKMYEKGQRAAVIEREEEIEELAVKKPDTVSQKELLDKLKHTQSELGRWQSLARKESYDGANRPETASDAMLQFMKDSMFHYLTDRDDCGVHLRAIVRMLGFTDDEKKRMIQLRKKVKKEKGAQFSGLLLDP